LDQKFHALLDSVKKQVMGDVASMHEAASSSIVPK